MIGADIENHVKIKNIRENKVVFDKPNEMGYEGDVVKTGRRVYDGGELTQGKSCIVWDTDGPVMQKMCLF